MRFCENEEVEVHEATGPDLAALLREAADLVEGYESWANVVTGPGIDEAYLVTVYLHG